MPKYLKSFAVSAEADGYRLHLETTDGESIDLLASFDQLDLMAEDIDRRLDADQDPVH